MFENFSFLTLLFLSALMWYLGFLIPHLCDKTFCNFKIRFLAIVPILIFQLYLQKPLSAFLKNINHVNMEPAWVISIINFLQANPIVPAALILLVFGVGGLYYLGICGTRKDQFKLGLIISAFITSFLLPLTLAGLISAGWGASTALAVLAEFLLIYFAKKR